MSDRCAFQQTGRESKEAERESRGLAAWGWGGLQTQVDDIEIRQGRRLVAATRSGSKTAVFKTEYESG
jgi:hypothetical protein